MEWIKPMLNPDLQEAFVRVLEQSRIKFQSDGLEPLLTAAQISADQLERVNEVQVKQNDNFSTVHATKVVLVGVVVLLLLAGGYRSGIRKGDK
ncbi:hypothetical protein GWO43_03215 [candidate division KSB1 bacterium]|nr:hypothetical protein [candidate division KSB1 bacterium]NIR70908.1 hypothetical protein [candidate division KSB1 bacterium]NIS23080.1 hypothetical protein [candidate division KSB1 bacterium]NIT69915.1 hypothetical protein [candidate division KSB1 bacterium]NIU23581.1 hypothetical protein [candidate division KSB1 bacterium]